MRASGTEPLIRVMVEGRDSDNINRLAMSVADEIRSAIKTVPERTPDGKLRANSALVG